MNANLNITNKTRASSFSQILHSQSQQTVQASSIGTQQFHHHSQTNQQLKQQQVLIDLFYT